MTTVTANLMSTLNGIVTALALLTFIGIVYWAFAKFRVKDNEQAAMLPFALPEDGQEDGQGDMDRRVASTQGQNGQVHHG